MTPLAGFDAVPLPHWIHSSLIGMLFGGVAAFIVINAGLRLIPEGRAFLGTARARGRLFAHPTRRAPRTVRRVFVLAWAAGVAAGLSAFWYMMTWQSEAPGHWPRPIRLAECAPC